MDRSIKTFLWEQFGAAIDMLENALIACPDELWNNGSKFWYIGFHTIFWLDYYLSTDTPMEKDFMPPAPYRAIESVIAAGKYRCTALGLQNYNEFIGLFFHISVRIPSFTGTNSINTKL